MDSAHKKRSENKRKETKKTRKALFCFYSQVKLKLTQLKLRLPPANKCSSWPNKLQVLANLSLASFRSLTGNEPSASSKGLIIPQRMKWSNLNKELHFGLVQGFKLSKHFSPFRLVQCQKQCLHSFLIERVLLLRVSEEVEPNSNLNLNPKLNPNWSLLLPWTPRDTKEDLKMRARDSEMTTDTTGN